MRRLMSTFLLVTAIGLPAGSAEAQESGIVVDLHGGIALPTFDFGDYRDPGPSLGGGIWFVPANRSWQVGAEVDFGFHGEDASARD